MQPQSSKKVVYSDQYKEELFWIWYNQGCPPLHDFYREVPIHRGAKPVYQSVVNWARENDWRERAKAQDSEVIRKIERESIDAKVEMLKRHAQVGEDLIEMGLVKLREDGITDQRTAVNAIKVGVAIETVSRGIPDALLKTKNMSDQQLIKIIKQLGSGIKPDELNLDDDDEGEILDVDVMELEINGSGPA